jgi:hypothetical protein
MKMAPVESSNIKAIGYNALALELHVEFKSGKTFAYKYVSPEDYVRLIQADSIGKHFVQFVKPGKEAVQVLGEPVEVVSVDSDQVTALKEEIKLLKEENEFLKKEKTFPYNLKA